MVEVARRMFTTCEEELDSMKVFKYIDLLLPWDDNDTQARRSKLRKVCREWIRLSWVLRADNASSKVCGMFYKATVQAVLLFRTKTSN